MLKRWHSGAVWRLGLPSRKNRRRQASAVPSVLTLVLCLDEILFRRTPVLVGVQPQSMAWVVGQEARQQDPQAPELEIGLDVFHIKKEALPVIDRKRLWWNCRPFREGKRRQRCPYQHLGLNLPTYDFWHLLQLDPQELTQKVSTAEVTI